jgi:hypothetical protein
LTTPGNPFAELPPLTENNHSRTQHPIDVLGNDLMIYEIRRGGMGEVYLCGVPDRDGPHLACKTFQKRFFFNRAVDAARRRSHGDHGGHRGGADRARRVQQRPSRLNQELVH